MKTSIRPNHLVLAEGLRRRVLEGAGETEPALRQSVAASASGGSLAPPPFDELARQIAEAAHRTTDEHVANVLRATGSEKAAFEVIFTAAVAAGLLRWQHAIRALEAAANATS